MKRKKSLFEPQKKKSNPNPFRQVSVSLLAKPRTTAKKKTPPPLDVKKGGDGWKLFKQMWSNYCIDKRLSDEEEACKRALFLHTLGKEGLALYNRMQLPADDFVDNIITAFDNHFSGRNSETYERYVFNKRYQKDDESFEDYIAALRSLASTCNFCDCLKDSLLRDRIVLGIKDSSTGKRLLQEVDLNLETCIAMCRAAEAASPSQPVKTEKPKKRKSATSPSQPVKTVTWTEDTTAVQAGSVSSGNQRPVKAVTWTEDTTAVQAGSVSSGNQRPGKKQDLSLNSRHCEPMASPDELEITEVNFNTEWDDSDDLPLQWFTEHQSSDVPCDRTEQDDKQEPAWSMEEDSPDQPSAVYSTAQPMSDNTSRSLLSLNTSHACRHCSTAFVLVSGLELHLASVHGEFTLDMVLPGSSAPDRCDAADDTIAHKEIQTEGCKRGRPKGSASKKETKPDRGDAGDFVGSDWDPDNPRSGQVRVRARRPRGVHDMVLPDECDVDVCSDSDWKPDSIKNKNKCKQAHSGPKPFVCDVCNKGFLRSCYLKAHMKYIHTKDNSYSCPHCDKELYSYASVQQHIMSVHEGKKPFLCDVCGVAFAMKCSLTRHRRTHTGENPYVCTLCGKGFAHYDSLLRHHRTHTGEKPYLCSDCGKAFTCRGNLNQHRVIHSNERSHVCPYCPAAFKWAYALRGHIRSKHQ